jgi:hypothetical protein
MQRKQLMCASAVSRSYVQSKAASPAVGHKLTPLWQLTIVAILCLLLGAGMTHAQGVNSAALEGSVLDPSGAGLRGAKITVTNTATGAERTTVSDDSGRYNLVGLPPGQYKVRVDGGPNFEAYKEDAVVLTVGDSVTREFKLALKGQQQSVEVQAESINIDPGKTEVSNTVTERGIVNLPINGRKFLDFTLLNSQTTRDMAPTIGPAPNSGLNIGGARARGNMVSVDGADATDNTINGVRSTLSQEGVQEFQLILSNYNAEYGRATGGVVNIVTKGGSNEFHGDVFGYFRNRAFQARNAFSGQVDPSTGNLDPIKQAYTRTQSGLAFGGPVKKDKTFFFFSYEYTQREETGFSSIGLGKFGLTTGVVSPCVPIPLSMTPSQLATYQGVLNTVTGGGASCSNPLAVNVETAALATGAASNVAVNGDINKNVDGNSFPIASALGFPLPPNYTGPAPFFPGPVACPATVQVNSVMCDPTSGEGLVPLPASFVALNSIRGNYPIEEKTSLWSARIDHLWNNHNHSFLRVGVSPSLVTGLPSTSQNQVFGQNSGSRAGYNQSRDLDFTFQHDTIVSDTAVNEFRMQVARRGLHFGFSQEPGGDQIGVNIPGTAYFGREPYSPVDRIERRFEFTDNVSLVRGKHTFKVGADVNVIQLRSAKEQIFQLDFGGVANFGGISIAAGLPSTTGLQSYGLGVPITYIQGIGSSNEPFDNLPFGFFAQDNWRLNRHLTVNYGVRYDVEITPLFSPLPGINAAAEKALGVTEGIPRDFNNVAPRFGIAWDPKGNGKTVIRAGYGIFYDHPLLAVAFDSATADGGRSTQLLSGGGQASACGLLPLSGGPTPPGFCGNGLDGPGNLNGASIFQGVLNANSIYAAFPTSLTLGYKPDEQRFDPFAAGSLFANQNYLNVGFPLPILPFTLPVGRNFVFGYAQQANVTIEREIAGSWKFSVGYQWTRGLHLNRPQDVNSTDPQLLDVNFADCNAAGFGSSVCGSLPVTVAVPSVTTSGANGCTFNPAIPGVLGTVTGCLGPLAFLNNTPLATVAAFNFFRPSGPNPSFAGPGAVAYPFLVGAAQASCFPTGFPLLGNTAPRCYPGGFGVPVAFNSVDAQLSNGNSWYNALTFNLTKRFSHHFELFSSYTWSHSIDDSTDLQSTLEPQDSRFPFLERSNSVNDQRHRWVTSAVFQSGSSKSGDGFFKHIVSDFTFSPIIEVASGRPFNVISSQDTRLDLGASQARPSVGGPAAATVSPFIPGVTFAVADVCLTNDGSTFKIPGVTTAGAGCIGNLGRNAFVTPGFFQWDMRLSKRIPLGERMKLDLIADVFNLFNRTNIAAVNQVCDPSAGITCSAGQPTAAYDARQFQFALKMSW